MPVQRRKGGDEVFLSGSGGAELHQVPQEESSWALSTILSAEKQGETARPSTSRSSCMAGTSAKPGPASGRSWHPRSGPGTAGTAAPSCCVQPASRSPGAASSSASLRPRGEDAFIAWASASPRVSPPRWPREGWGCCRQRGAGGWGVPMVDPMGWQRQLGVAVSP